MKYIILLGALVFVLAGCTTPGEIQSPTPGGAASRMGGGMMDRHHAQIPAEYAGLSNSIPANPESFERGAAIYSVQCASCHGDGGMGDGPAGAALNPAPAAVAHTSQMLGDDYLFWRISEGSASFNTSMPGWKATLDENSRWDVINYIRALGTGEVEPQRLMGGANYDPAVEAARQAELLSQAVAQKVISQAEAETFKSVHDAVEQYRTEHPELLTAGASATEREAAILQELIKNQIISQAEADAFTEIHDRLGAAGLMP